MQAHMQMGAIRCTPTLSQSCRYIRGGPGAVAAAQSVHALRRQPCSLAAVASRTARHAASHQDAACVPLSVSRSVLHRVTRSQLVSAAVEGPRSWTSLSCSAATPAGAITAPPARMLWAVLSMQTRPPACSCCKVAPFPATQSMAQAQEGVLWLWLGQQLPPCSRFGWTATALATSAAAPAELFLPQTRQNFQWITAASPTTQSMASLLLVELSPTNLPRSWSWRMPLCSLQTLQLGQSPWVSALWAGVSCWVQYER